MQSNAADVEPDAAWAEGAAPPTESCVPVAFCVVHDSDTVGTGQLASVGPENEAMVGGGIVAVVVVVVVVVVGADVVVVGADVVVGRDVVVVVVDVTVTFAPLSRVAAPTPTPLSTPTTSTTAAPKARPPRLVGSPSSVPEAAVDPVPVGGPPDPAAPARGTARVAASPGAGSPPALGTARVGSSGAGGPGIARELCHRHRVERAQLPGDVRAAGREQHLGSTRFRQGIEPCP